ncbi:MAG TPA: TonB-dependent receptor [Chitinophagaceae bacterium]|nr:TonB-dependent receptor [Chitinophagaceae bacterium]
MKSKTALALLFFLAGSYCYSQKGTIEGSITDAESNTPLNGAIINLGIDKGDNSDMFGHFSFPAVNPGQYEMIVSHVGYRTAIIPVEVKPHILSTVIIHLRKATLDLSEVRINSRKTTGLNAISAVDIRLRPVNTSQDVLRIVPGLFIAQHAGGGKAEQIFLRGFDIDHGTDIAISVDGLPVNMVSHAHGQGYADLHFVIPETVEKVNFDKGPYAGSKGNFATSAYVDFATKDFLDNNSVKVEGGQFNMLRVATLLKLFNKSTEKSRQQFYIASEYSSTDGYFDSPQEFHRFNIMGKYNAWFGNQSQLTIMASSFDSKWKASGQVPDRAIRSGMIGRFGAIDDTEGGNTSRINLDIKFNRQWKNKWKTTDQLYFSRYKFNLFSNFTFFLDDPVNGDMINQKEGRDIWGYTTAAARSYLLGGKKATTELGAGFRYDNIVNIELAKNNRTTFFNSIQKGAIKEINSFLYINQDIELTDKFNLVAALRYDHFIFKYRDELAGKTGFEKERKGTFSPKLNFNYSFNQKIKIFLNNGIGFHSNDTRVILDRAASNILPKVFGTDLGVLLKPHKNVIIKTVLWHLFSQQEFVYVGDAGVVEPGDKTRRMGIDVSARYQFSKWLFADVDLNMTRARAIGEPKGNDHVPLAPSFTSIGGLTARSKQGFSGSLRYRLMGERPANEDKSVIAEGYFLLDMILSYRLKKFDFTISTENLLNRDWREAQFDTESKMRFEADPVSEIHYTPGTPRSIKGSVTFYF